jgi:hypothetical protein
VPIRCRLGDDFGRDDAVRTGTVVDDDLLAPGSGQSIADAARDQIRRTPGSERNEHADGAFGIVQCAAERGADARGEDREHDAS